MSRVRKINPIAGVLFAIYFCKAWQSYIKKAIGEKKQMFFVATTLL
jgi:hypothetical protein